MNVRRFIFAALLVLCAQAKAQTTRLSLSAGQIELAANLIFDREDYGSALPMYERLLDLYDGNAVKIESIQERIRFCKRNLKNPATLPAVKKVEGPRKPHEKPKADEVLDLDMRDLGNFEYDPEKGGVPQDVAALSGVKFRTRGFMIPIDQTERMTQFALVPSLMACCMGLPPGVNHMIVARAPAGKTVKFSPDEIVVEGTLKVAEKKEDGFVVSLFEVDCTSVKAAPKE